MKIFFMNFKRNMKAAFITVKSGLKDYVCFIIALTMVQMLFCVLCISIFNDANIEDRLYAESGYDYHCAITGMDESDVNDLMTVFEYHRLQEKLKFTYRFSRNNNCQVIFGGDYASCFRVLSDAVRAMNEHRDHVSIQTTPLYEHDLNAGKEGKLLLPLLAITGLLSYLLITALFRIRLNHFRFTYGVYMTFGADRKKLLAAAFYEMLLLVFLTFPPAVLLSYGCAALLYLPRQNPFGFFFAPLPITLLCSLVCALLALLLPIGLLARTMPVKVLKAEDNSNLASPARRSIDPGKRGVLRTELTGMWRFRKYLAILLVSTVGFSAVFYAGCCIAHAYSLNDSVREPSFTVRAKDEGKYRSFTSFFKTNADANDIPAVIEKNAANPFAPGGAREKDVPPALAVEKKKAAAGCLDEMYGGGYLLTDRLELRAYDADARDCLTDVYSYTVKGDPDLPLTDPGAVVISSTFANSRALKISPGDTVWVSVNYYPYPDGSQNYQNELTAGERSERGSYIFLPCRVAAVIEDYASYDGMLLCLPVCAEEGEKSLWESVTGSSPAFTEAKIYLDNETDEKTAARIIRDYLADYGGIEYEQKYASVSEDAAVAKNRPGLIMLLSLLVLLVSPLTGIFSQILFYGKRRGEFDVLRAVGAQRRDLLKIFFVDGVLTALTSGVLYLAVAQLLSQLIRSFLNSELSALFSGGIGRRIYGSLFLPGPFALGLCLTVLFAVVGVVLPAVLYLRSASDHVGRLLAEEELS